MLHAMRAFEAAARHLSFTRAADELHVTPGAVSQQVKLLEDRLGAKLFQRMPRELVLTADGRKLAEAAASAFECLGDAILQLQDSGAQTRLCISCSPSFAMMWLLPRLSGFNRLHPEIELRLKAEFHRLEPARMRSEATDLAIRYEPAPAAGLDAAMLMPEYLLPVAGSPFAQRRPLPLSIEALTSLPLLHDASPWDGAPPFSEWLDWLGKATGSGSERSGLSGHQFNLSQLAIRAALEGQGVAMGRSALVLDELRAGRLHDVSRIAVRADAAYFLASLPEARDNAACGAFRAWLAAECADFDASRRAFLGL